VGAERQTRSRRLRAPLLLSLGALLAVETLGGLVLFTARLAWSRTPGETLHVITGAILSAVYVIYQWRHWVRVRPFRNRLEHGIGLLAAITMTLALLSGLTLGAWWWRDRVAAPIPDAVRYPVALSAAHNIASLLALAFVFSHLGTVLRRDRRGS
jgi:hypothetical protein